LVAAKLRKIYRKLNSGCGFGKINTTANQKVTAETPCFTQR
jgi:hypothetical protein